MLLAVGRILRPHGVRGEVMVEVRTDDPGERFASGRVLATRPEALGPLRVSKSRPHAGGLIVGFAQVTERAAADKLRGVWLVIDSADVPAPDDPDEFRDHQLIGLHALTVDGRRVGTVTDVRHHGQDLLVIRRDLAPGATADSAAGAAADSAPDSAAELLVPFVAAIVPEVDLTAGHLLIDPPPGLLDDHEPA